MDWLATQTSLRGIVMTEPIAESMKRPSRYAMVDGVGEMGIGIVFAGMSIILRLSVGQRSIWSWKPTVVICLAVLLVLVLLAEATVKSRITFRRTGYVKYRHSRVQTALAVVVAAILAAFISYFLKHSPRGENLQLLLGSLSMCVLYAYGTKMDQAWRWIVVIAMVLAPLATRSIVSSDPGQWLSTGIIGICWLVSGLVTFWLYLRRTRPAQGAQ
jgi:hypothetical protein